MEGDTQSLFPPQGSIADGRVPLTAWPGALRNWDPLLQDSSWCLAVAPLPSTLSPAGQIPETVAQMVPTSDKFDSNVWNSVMAAADNQTYWNNFQPLESQDATGSLPPTSPADHFLEQRMTFPFAQIHDVQFHDRNPSINGFHGPCVSPQPFPCMPLPHSRSLVQPHPDQITDAPEFTGPRRDSEISNIQSSRHRGKECPYVNCNKKYGRPQELKRHIKDKHRIPPRCPFCGIEFTRAEKIRRHLIGQHNDRFSSEERKDIYRLQGWEATIGLVEKCGAKARNGRSGYHGQESRRFAGKLY
ncbi:hypothetical protein BC827DRAFT_1153172 [Russula dissimulans]|nr:hypothetical protein BC827DRAFT_1153172 [Russula dissimulans]